MATVPPDVLTVLGAADLDGHMLRLTGQLDRPLYIATNKVLEAAGGKWNRSAKAHVFDDDPSDVLDMILLTGEYTDARREFDAFYTPMLVVEMLFERAAIQPGQLVLEPSAGDGALLTAAVAQGANVIAYELRTDTAIGVVPGLIEIHRGVDFLTVPARPDFDRVVMNPPFSRQQDMLHVSHAYQFLKPGGRLVAVMSPAFTFRSTALAVGFREMVDEYGEVDPLPDGSFNAAGTGVRTVLVTLER